MPTGTDEGLRPDDLSLGALVQLWRDRALLTQEQLAQRSGLGVRTIRRLERDELVRRPRSSSLWQLAAALNLSDAEQDVLVAAAREMPTVGAQRRSYVAADVHVSAWVQKHVASNRLALAEVAARTDDAGALSLPSSLTSFVGRVKERAELTDAVKAHRMVTAVGLGGVGKTRLAVAVATDLATEFADGVCFVDLVPLTDPAMVAAAIAVETGVGEQQGHNLEDAVIASMAGRRGLLVLDNCEHVLVGVSPLVERLLTRCPGMTVLATSRARLMVPFEHVYPVPPLSLAAEGSGEAEALFAERAASVGRPVAPQQQQMVGALCQALGGVALAIELAAARLPVLGYDGLAAGLSDQLRLLTGGSRAEDRHRSVRAMLDWGHALLDEPDRRLLRLVSVFVAPFTANAVATVVEEPIAAVFDGLARLAEQSLLTVLRTENVTRYRALETIRQYSMELAESAGELRNAQSRHLHWALTEARDLEAEDTELDAEAAASDVWRARFDTAADDLRSALRWAADDSDHRIAAYELALRLARLTFTRSLVAEAQQRFEQAAALAPDPAAAASALRDAAAMADCRFVGEDMYRLNHAAGDAALRAGKTSTAARDWATAVVAVYRFSGLFTVVPPLAEVRTLLEAARELIGDDPAAIAAVALADCGERADMFGSNLSKPEITVPETLALADRAVELARATHDPLAESAALDAMIGAQCWAGDILRAADTARRRITLLTAMPTTPAAAEELVDVLAIAAETSVGAGDLRAARWWGRRLRDLPLLTEHEQFATSWLLVADALAGDIAAVLADAERFVNAWERSGRPRTPALYRGVVAVAAIHGLRGDTGARAEWLAKIERPDKTTSRWVSAHQPIFDAIVELHQGRARNAVELLAPAPDQRSDRNTWIWAHWHAGLRAEAAVLTEAPDTDRQLAEARTFVIGNPIAMALVERADALANGNRAQLLAAADAFQTADCPYQRARTLSLADDDDTALQSIGFSRPIEQGPGQLP